MGHGAARELEKKTGPVKPLPPDLSEKVGAALKQLDAIDEGFKERRDDELYTQHVKRWGNIARGMDEHLRTLAKVLIEAHQISLDIGSDGGGASMKPWLEETSMVIDRLYFKLVDGTRVHATYKDETFLEGSMEDAQDYDWIEKAVCRWIEVAVAEKQKGE